MRRLLAMDPTLNIYIGTAFSQEFLDDLKQAQAEGLSFQLANKPLSSTPMLVREVPEPVLKLLGDLSRMQSVLSAITAENGHGAGTIVL